MDKELTVKLTNSEIISLINIVKNKLLFFRNELKKQGQLESYIDFCKEREEYYVDLYSKLLSSANLTAEELKDEEPKEYWYIESDGSIIQNHKPTYINHLLDGLKFIGNYFETKEEAEKAVEKLKAWKRLKDKGFRFSGFDYTELHDYARVNIRATMINDSINDDLELLFGDTE